MQGVCKGTAVWLFTWSPITGGILTGEWGNQPLHQSLSSIFSFDSWCDTHCCSCLMGGLLFHLNQRWHASTQPTYIKRFSCVKTDRDQSVQWQKWQTAVGRCIEREKLCRSTWLQNDMQIFPNRFPGTFLRKNVSFYFPPFKKNLFWNSKPNVLLKALQSKISIWNVFGWMIAIIFE